MTDKEMISHMSRAGRLRLGIGLVAIAIAAGLPPTLANASSGGPCDARIAPAYLRPFRPLPPIRTLAPMSQVPFAPRGVLLGQVSSTKILTPGQFFGYEFPVRHMPKGGLRLNWRVSVSVARLQPDGVEIGRDLVLERTLRRVRVPGYLDELWFGVRMPEEPGIYRYRLRVQRLDGTHLGQVERYARVMPERWRVELRTRARYVAGSRGMLRLANRGSLPVSFGEGFVVKVRRGGRWRPSPYFPVRPVKRIAFVLYAGEVDKCVFFPIPKATPAGTYRIEKRVTSRDRDRDREEVLTARFVVRRKR